MGKKKGGKFLASGNNTCVFDPPVKCVGSDDPHIGMVSRIVPPGSVDLANQEEVKVAFKGLYPQYQKNFNFFKESCKAEFRPEDNHEECDVDEIRENPKLGPTELINLITPIQDGDVNMENPEKTLPALREFLHAVLDMNSFRVQVFHADGHKGNISWMGGNVVLHDWEKATVGDTEFWKSLSLYEGNGWGGLIGANLPLDRLPMVERENFLRLKDLTKYLHWKYPIEDLLDKTKISDRYVPGKEIPSILEVGFRFWDIMAILPVIRVIFSKSSLPNPPIIQKIDTEITSYWKKLESSCRVRPQLGAQKAELLEAITNKLKKIVDDAYATNGASRTRRQNARSYPKRSGRHRALNTRKPSFRRN